jgi:DNA-binding NtrC family response regulator
VVDDDSSAHRVIESALSDECILHFAGDAQVALQVIAEHPIKLVLLELFSDSRGLELFRRIRKNDSHLPVIVVTGHSTTRSVIKAINLRVSGYLTKPIDGEYLKKKVRVALNPGNMRYYYEALRHGEEFTYLDTARCLIHERKGRITVRRLAEALEMPVEQLRHLFREESLCSWEIDDFIIQVRLNHAIALLRGTDLAEIDIARRVGFQSFKKFLQHFERYTGRTPFDYRF